MTTLTEAQVKALCRRMLRLAVKLWLRDRPRITLRFRVSENKFGEAGMMPENHQGIIYINHEECVTPELCARTMTHEVFHYLSQPLFDLALEMADESDAKALKGQVVHHNERLISSLEEIHWEDLMECV